MKRFFAICLTALLVVAALTGCRGGSTTDPASPIVSASPSPAATDNGGMSGMSDDTRGAGQTVNGAAEDRMNPAVSPTISPSASPSANSAK
jgi:hypothetical protein